MTRTVKCKECGKTFGSRSALGGHVRNVHARQDGGGQGLAQAPPSEPSTGQPPATAPPPGTTGEPPVAALPPGGAAAPEQEAAPEEAQATVAAAEEAEPDKADVIRKLLSQGFSPQQIKEQFGYSRSTVDGVAAAFLKPATPPRGDAPADGLPVIRKGAGGVEMVNPEAVLRNYLLQDGEAGKCMLKGMMLLRAAQLMVMEDVAIMKGQADAHAQLMKPILDVMKETRAEQDAAAERSRSSSLEAAREAAEHSLSRAMPYIDQRLDQVEAAMHKKPDIASTPNPMQGVMARTMETMFDRLMGAFGFGGQASPEGGVPSQMTGVTWKKTEGGPDA